MKTPDTAAKKLPHPKYRADIDGLRAVAVLAVVCCHAFPKVFEGGFIGVDIFFIISGFLISTILISSLEKDTFSFKEFYIRRILRIFPALIVVLSACYIVGWLVLLPEEFQQLGKHMLGGAGSVSNLFFWQEAGYFDNSAATKPLLHLWSLGVEEQFYIVWPCLLLLAWKRNINALKMAAFIIVGSFALNVYTVYTDAVQSFYSPITRFWELLLGGLLAYIQLHKIEIDQHVRQTVNNLLSKFTARSLPALSPATRENALSILGALLIVFAVIFVDKKNFPGWWALLPALGALLIISAGPRSVLNRLVLSSRPMVWVGLISYPLYLWHWPLLSFATIMETKTPALGVRMTAVFLAVVLAWLTYLFIERPIRFGQRSKIKISSLALLMIMLATSGSVAFVKGNVRSSTLTKEIADQDAKLDFALHFAKWSPCPDADNDWNCKILNPLKPPEIALIGDSHSVHLASGLAEMQTIADQNIINRNGNGCMPVFELELAGKRYYSCDDDVIKKGLEEAINSESIKTIMLSGYAVWKIRPIDDDLKLEAISAEQVEENAAILEKALNITLSRLVASDKQIVFFVDTPVLDFEPTECVTMRPFYLPGHTPKDPCALSRALFDQRNAEYHRIIQSARNTFPTVKFINLYDYLCDQEQCYASKDDVLLYMDHSHLSADGSRYLFAKMADDLKFGAEGGYASAKLPAQQKSF
ncbi:MAG: acyltransferase [Deltaproteobacteria bacterium]|nr:acyltransferase [Deltaproteobacteria bacterium]